MSIATMDELRALPEGARIRVGSGRGLAPTDWEKIPDGQWRHMRVGHTAQEFHFVGAVGSRLVDLIQPEPTETTQTAALMPDAPLTYIDTNSPIAVGDVFMQTATSQYRYLVVDTSGRPVIHVAKLRANGTLSVMTNRDETALRGYLRVDRNHPHHTSHYTMAMVAMGQRLVGSGLPDELVTRLAEFAQSDAELRDMLAEYDIGVHRSDVDVAGSFSWTVDRSTIPISDDYNVNDYGVSVPVTRTVVVTKAGVECTCDQVTVDDIYDSTDDISDVEIISTSCHH